MTARTFETFPVAVHTAHYGYDWSQIPSGWTRERLDALYRRAVACRGFNYESVSCWGVLTEGEVAVAFRLGTAKAWDVNGRDAEYAVFVFIPFTSAAKVNFAALWQSAVMSEPSRTPAVEVENNFPAAALAPTAMATLRTRIAALTQTESSALRVEEIGWVLGVYGSLATRWTFVQRGLSAPLLTSLEPRPQKSVSDPPVSSSLCKRPALVFTWGHLLLIFVLFLILGVLAVLFRL